MNKIRAVSVGVVVLLVLAGCSGFSDPTISPSSGTIGTTTTTTTETPSPTPTSEIRVQGGTLPVDVDLVFERVQQLLGTDVDPNATRVTVKPREESSSGGGGPKGFAGAMGIVPPEETSGGNGSTGHTSEYGTVTIYLGDSPPWAIEALLAHEFAHVVQFHHGVDEDLEDARIEGTNDHLVRKSVIEGGATYTEAAYMRTYLDVDGTIYDWVRIGYENSSAYGKHRLGPYYFGTRYVQDRIDSPADLEEIYDDPPRSTEQIIHGYDPDEELPKDLSVGTETGESWFWSDVETRGEMFVRVALSSELNDSHAGKAAAGWGADRLLTFENGSSEQVGYAWVLRWDDPSEADEFEDATTTYLDRRGERADGHWRDGDLAFRPVRVDDDTVVLFVGPPEFVRNASASGSNDRVTVTVDDATGG